MSFLDINLNEAKELVAVEEGEHELRVTNCELAEVKKEGDYKGDKFIKLSFDIPAVSNSKGITHTLFLPRERDDEKQRNNALLRLKSFCDCFGFDYSNGIDLDLIKNSGATGWAFLGLEESEEYGEQNRIKRFVVES